MGAREDFFNNLIGQVDPYSDALTAADTLKYTPTRAGDEGAALGVALGRMVLKGILGGKSEKYRREQSGALNSVLGDLITNPREAQRPEGLDPAIFGEYQRAALEQDAQRELQRADEERKLRDKLIADATNDNPIVRNAVLGSLGINLPELLGHGRDESEAPAVQFKASPKSREQQINERLAEGFTRTQAEKIIDSEYERGQDALGNTTSLRKEFLSAPIVEDFQLIESNLDSFVQALNDPHPVSDYQLIRNAAQSVEPGLAVRRDDERSIQEAASMFGMGVQAMRNLIQGKSRLTPGQRKGIARTVQRNYDAKGQMFNRARSKYAELAEGSGLNPESVAVYGEAPQFQEIYPDLNIAFDPDEEKLDLQLSDGAKTPISSLSDEELLRLAEGMR